ncbi:MAG: PIN domain-containing protein [Holophagaceae bacterium]|nr:PIN domain-containing protein [Holophagaceae bacterium]
MIYALDSNIVSYILKEDAKVVSHYRQALKDDCEMVIPPIVYYEVQRGLLAKGLRKYLATFDKLYQSVLQVGFDMPVWKMSAEIYSSLCQQGKPIEDADIFIAAYCLVNDYTLVTNNTRHFERVDGLKTINWK